MLPRRCRETIPDSRHTGARHESSSSRQGERQLGSEDDGYVASRRVLNEGLRGTGRTGGGTARPEEYDRLAGPVPRKAQQNQADAVQVYRRKAGTKERAEREGRRKNGEGGRAFMVGSMAASRLAAVGARPQKAGAVSGYALAVG